MRQEVNPKKYILEITGQGELAAGIRSFTDVVTITIGSGDPGGEDGEFEDFLKQSFSEWYDGANVWLKPST